MINNEAKRHNRRNPYVIFAVLVFLVALLESIDTFVYFPLDRPFPYVADFTAMFTSAGAIAFCVAPVLRRLPSRTVRVAKVAATSLFLALLGLQGVAFIIVAANGAVRRARRGDHLAHVSLPMRDATVAMEDGQFYDHRGFDLEGIHRALRVNARTGSLHQGGSTITQQLAKNLFLSNDRTWLRKVLEVPLAIGLECFLSKGQILDLYLQSVMYGNHNRGISEASSFYFHTDPSRLGLAQAVCLVGMVPHNPAAVPSESLLDDWRRVALNRMAGTFPDRYPDESCEAASRAPIRQIMYPFRAALQSGATDTISPGWNGVLWFSSVSDSEPLKILDVAPSLKACLREFTTQARSRYGLVAIYRLERSTTQVEKSFLEPSSAREYGRAIDIVGFRYLDGSTAWIRDRNRKRAGERINEMRLIARGIRGMGDTSLRRGLDGSECLRLQVAGRTERPHDHRQNTQNTSP